MIQRSTLEKSLLRTESWFRNSGVMVPADGAWGVAERVLLTENNKTKDRTLSEFPAWTPHDKYCIVEQRRADCSAETAFLYLRLASVFHRAAFRKIAENILDFLFNRSGLLVRFGPPERVGTWDWSHIRRAPAVWFDDNAWMVILCIKIGRAFPALDKKYSLIEWGMRLAGLLADAFPRYFRNPKEKEPSFAWLGTPGNPHWGSLVCMALSEACKVRFSESFRTVVTGYHEYLRRSAENLTVSEYGYALMGAVSAFRVFKDKQFRETADLFASMIVSKMDPSTGSLPSEHYEAPSGKALADTIYTLNWAVLGLQDIARIDKKYEEPLERMLSLLLRIQDSSAAKYLKGCWRGMFDLEAGVWGGGDSFEGGANSIYTGWTNAPIAWAVSFELQKKSLSEM